MTAIRQRTATVTPGLAALAAALVGLINVASALTPNIRWRGHLLLEFEPVEAMRLFHAFALPAGAALLLVSPYLLKRRRRAWQAAIVLMLVLGVLDLLKGLDFEETVITWATAGLLIAGGDAFGVEHDRITGRSVIWRVPLLGVCGLALTGLAVWATQGHPSWSSVARETGNLLLWRGGPLRFRHLIHFHHHSVAWVVPAVHLVELSTLVAVAYVVFRPLATPKALPGPGARRAAADIVRAHGRDTLSFFKLGGDKRYLFSADRTAFVGYRIEAGVLLVSGDPVGSLAALPQLIADVRAFAAARGLKISAVGASQRARRLYEDLGLRTIYLGDEAIIELACIASTRSSFRDGSPGTSSTRACWGCRGPASPRCGPRGSFPSRSCAGRRPARACGWCREPANLLLTRPALHYPPGSGAPPVPALKWSISLRSPRR